MFSIFPKDDQDQTLRIKRFLMAFGAYLIWSTLCFVAYSLDLTTVSLKILVAGVLASIFVNILLYVIFRTELNKRFNDPSLTLLQMVVATFWIMLVVYYAYEARSAVLLVYMVVLVFGFFRLKARQFLFLSVYAWLNYSVVIFIIYKIHPESVNKRVDIFNIIVLAFILPWFAMIGGYINKLRAKISNSFSTIQRLNDNIQDVIFILDMNLNYTYISPSVKILMGYEPEEVLKQTPFDAFTPSSLDLAKRTLYEVMELEKLEHKAPLSRTLQLEISRKDGSTVWTETKVSFIRDKNKRPVGILGAMRDITERKQMEEKLQNEEQQFRTLTEQSSDIILLVNRERIITYENPAVCILGLNYKDRIGASVFDHIHPDDLKLITDSLHILFNDTTAPVQKADVRLHCMDGSWRTFQAMGSNLVHDKVAESVIVNLHDITERKRTEDKLQQTLESLRKAFGTTIQVMVSAVEMRDPYTAGHQIRVADIARAIATEMGFAQERIDGIRMSGTIHDIGKLSIPAEILSKPTKLTDIEFSLIKEHSRIGYEIVKDVESPWPLAEILYQHHERMNGSGYPRNLKGDEILMDARILAVADVVEAIASHRPYRAALGIEAALEEIEKNKGILYDVAVAEACIRVFREKGYQLK